MHATGRFAPSPTGAMHLGNVRTALLAWLSARSAGGRMILRIEDLDASRVVPGAEQKLLDDLAWLGLDWDEGPDAGGPFAPYRQSERAHLYDEATHRLLESGQAFLCACSRADVARAANAPHGEEGPRYPGTCRDRDPAAVEAMAAGQGRRPTIRFRGGGRALAFADGLHGPVDPLGAAGLDDFVIRRADGCAAYQLAVVVDDAAMGVTEVVRGDDLLSSTPRQLALYRALDLTAPRFSHVPLVLAPGGERLAKRTRPQALADLRENGVAPEAIVGALAASAGLCPAGYDFRPRDLVPGFLLDRVSRTAVTLDRLA
jgi:glutamyl-tRNA synthetase